MTTALPTLPHAGTLLLAATVGSHAYGLAGPDSDVDTLGTYRAATDVVLGLDGPAAVKHSVVTTDPDVTLHEVGKFCALALKANPTILELLWAADAPDATVCPGGGVLVAHRRAFLSAPAVRSAYGGYATQQARRLLNRHRGGREGFNSDLRLRTAKHGRHCWRLMLMGLDLLRTGDLTLDVSSHRSRLFAMGELAVSDPEAFEGAFTDAMAAFDSAETVLPDTPDRDRINDLLVAMRRMEP